MAETAFKSHAALRHTPQTARTIITAHSGGGAALAPLLPEVNPHEVHVFDALYSEAPALMKWAETAIEDDARVLATAHRSEVAVYMARWGRALRVFYIPGTGTEAASLNVKSAIDNTLARVGPVGALLAPWYQVTPTKIEHGMIPRRLGWLLLADGGVGGI